MAALPKWIAATGCAALLIGAVSRVPSSLASSPARSASVPVDTEGAHGQLERPRATVDVEAIDETPDRITVIGASGDLQSALDAAKPGDRLVLQPGVTYRGPFRLPRKNGDGWIVVASAAAGELPKAGHRVNPSHAALMPKLVSAGDTVVSADPGAHHYRFIGVEIAPAEHAFVTALVQIGADERTPDALPHHIILDRCYLHGNATIGARRGVAMNSRDTAVVDSYLSDFKEVGNDSQAIAGWNGPGPFKIAGNYLEAAGENIMFGGADPRIPGLVPADIEVLHNHVAKPHRWMPGHPEFEGVTWAVKNLFELKNARRVRIDGNLFEGNWPGAQNGFAILFTVRNQDGGAPWSTVEDVTFTNNLVRHVAAGINMLARDDNHPSQRLSRVDIRNNLFLDVGDHPGTGRLVQLLDGTADVHIDHNTALQSGNILFGGDHDPHTGFVYQNNIALNNTYGVVGSGTGPGAATLARYFPLAVFRRNIIVGGPAEQYPPDNFFPRSLAEIGIRQTKSGIERLSMARPYAGAGTDGRDPGADTTQIATALSEITPPGWLDDSDPPQAGGGADETPPREPPSHRRALGAFAICALLLGYIYVGYPLVARLRSRRTRHAARNGALTPTVTVVVVAHNEADRIGPRLDNLLAMEYPRDRLQIIVGSDGSSDDTVAVARRYSSLGVVVRAFNERRGKTAVLNRLVPTARGEIVVFADARQRFDANAISALVANFADPTVGAVSGELILTTTRDTVVAGRGTAFYWRYEKFIRAAESRAGSMVGATGAIYAIRRELFEPIPDDTILDDVLIPLRIVRQGFQVIFESGARAYDAAAETATGEFARKVRTIAGSFQLFARETWLFNPRKNPVWFETMSHKVLRLAIPLLHVGLLAANIALLDMPVSQVALAAQLAFYVAAVAGWTQRHARRRSMLVTVPYAMCLLGSATVVGFIRFATDRQRVTWERVPHVRIERSGHVGRAA